LLLEGLDKGPKEDGEWKKRIHSKRRGHEVDLQTNPEKKKKLAEKAAHKKKKLPPETKESGDNLRWGGIGNQPIVQKGNL